MKQIPEAYHSFLTALTFTSPGTEATPLVRLLPDTPCMTADGRVSFKNGVALYQREHGQGTLSGFRKLLLSLLREAGHVATEPVADAILSCVVKAAQTGEDRAAFLQDLLTRFHKADVSHFFVLPVRAITEPMWIEGYRFGAVDLPVLTSRCNRAQSDYAQLYSKKLAGRLTLQSPEFPHVVIDFLKPMLARNLSNDSVWRDLLLNYFERISRLHFEFMWSHLDRTQMLASPFGAHLLDVLSFRSDMGQFAEMVTVYLGFSRIEAGYIVPEQGTREINQPGPDSEAYRRFSNHRDTYRLSEVGDSELGRTIFACAGFCQQAVRFLESGRADDAALYATICLEHLFSEKQATGNAVCSRAAILTHLRMADCFAEAEGELRKLYDARSRFVHAGTPVTPPQAERLVAYARETLRSLLVLHLEAANRSAGFLERWVKELDIIVAVIRAGRTCEPSFYAENGIFQL